MSLPEPFIIAEISGNHNGSLERALALIEAAADAGADAVKFQCFDPDTLTVDCDRPEYTINEGPWAGRTLHSLYTETQTPREWFPKLFETARDCNVTAFSSVFAKEDVDFLETLDCPIYKISSFEITDIPLIEYAASKGKPIIISIPAGADYWHMPAYDADFSFLRCVSDYPAVASGALCVDFTTYQGFSDHTLSTVLPAVAIGMGATVIEKHLTLSRDDGGADAGFSLEPHEFKEMVLNCWEAWEAIQPAEPQTPYKGLRKSVRAVRDIQAGEPFTEDNVRSVRPSGGLEPKHLPSLLGTIAKRPISRGEPIMEADLA